MTEGRKQDEWEGLYREQEIETMAWFYEGLDPDLEGALEELGITGGSALDLGTGPGTQAMGLAERGFEVVATDLSGTAVKKARERAEKKGVRVEFRQDDILSTALTGEFDFIFDRGCLHTLPPEKRYDYVRVVHGLVKPGGFLFLKCMSISETHLDPGPHRFAPGDIQGLFSSKFKLISIEDTVYHGTMDPLPKALFCVMERF